MAQLRDAARECKSLVNQLGDQIAIAQKQLQDLKDQRDRAVADLAEYQAFFDATGKPRV